ALARPAGPPLVGLELEWLTHPVHQPRARVELDALQRATAAIDLPCSSAISIEPGGQVELSTRPAASISAAIGAMQRDAAVLDSALRDARIAMVCAAV